jgi:two-component system LytT family sensor kinase
MKLGEKNRQLIRIAAIINGLFLLLCILLVLFMSSDNSETQRYFRKIAAFAIANIACWLINIFLIIFLLPAVNKEKQERGVLFYILSFVTSMSVVQLLSSFVIAELHLKTPNIRFSPLLYAAIFNAVSLLAIELIISRFEKSRMKFENAELKMMSLQAEHEKLKNQLHPHFLFNSLNALKSLMRKNPAQAESYLIKLAEFLRFSISHNEQNIVPLGEELKFSLYYLEMQKIRFPESLKYEVDQSLLTLNGAMLPVFSLQLLLENAIKHNALTNENPLCIHIRYMAPDYILVENNLSEKLNIEPGSGLGLKNLSDRYLLLTNQKIDVKKNSTHFQVSLKIIYS